MDDGAFREAQRYLDLWITQRNFELSFVYCWFEPWVNPSALVSDDPPAAREMFSLFWLQTMFQARSDAANFGRLRTLLKTHGLQELRRTVLDPKWCAEHFDQGACGNWRHKDGQLTVSRRKDAFLEVCNSCSRLKQCSVPATILARHRTLPISISPSVLMVRWRTASEQVTADPPAIRMLRLVGDYDTERHRLRAAVPAVKESVFGMLTDCTDPLLWPLTSRLARWHIPTAGKFMETWVGRMPGIPNDERGRIDWLKAIKQELDARCLDGLDGYLQRAAERLPGYSDTVATTRGFLKRNGLSLRFLTHIIWNAGIGQGSDRPEVSGLHNSLRTCLGELSDLPGAVDAARVHDPESFLDRFLLPNLRPLDSYPEKEAAQIRAFLSKYWGVKDSAYLLGEDRTCTIPVARLLTMTAQWCLGPGKASGSRCA